MSLQNNMAKESYPYKIIVWLTSSSSHTKFKSCTTLMTSQSIVSYFWCSQTFSIFTQYMSVSHGHRTLGGIEWWLWRRQKGEDSITSTWCINELWRCPSIDVNARSRDCHATDALELRMLNKRKLVGVHPTCLLMKT